VDGTVPFGHAESSPVDEPVDIKREYNRLSFEVREAALGQSSDFSKLVYRRWKEPLRQAGLTWLDGELSWRLALAALVERLNQRINDPLTFG
jgi:hypothetical protein